jgi:hypothetical protein
VTTCKQIQKLQNGSWRAWAAWPVTELYVVEEVWELLMFETVQVQSSCGNNLQLLVFVFIPSVRLRS